MTNMETVLQDLVERIEKDAAERQDISERISGHYAELKAEGFDVKAVRRLVALRKLDRSARRDLVSMVALYSKALGEEDDLV